MISLLLWNGPRFAAAVGICGWVPLKARMEREIRGGSPESRGDDPLDGGKPVEDAAVQHFGQSNLKRAVKYLREELELETANRDASSTVLMTPVFIGHGKEDPQVPIRLGEEANDLLRLIGLKVDFRLYDGLGHWYSSEMLQDIVGFFEQKTNVKPAVSQLGSQEDNEILQEAELKHMPSTGFWKSLGEKVVEGPNQVDTADGAEKVLLQGEIISDSP